MAKPRPPLTERYPGTGAGGPGPNRPLTRGRNSHGYSRQSGRLVGVQPEAPRDRRTRETKELDRTADAVGLLKAVATRGAVDALLALGARPCVVSDFAARTLDRLAGAGLVVVTDDGTVCLTPSGRRVWVAVRALVV